VYATGRIFDSRWRGRAGTEEAEEGNATLVIRRRELFLTSRKKKNAKGYHQKYFQVQYKSAKK